MFTEKQKSELIDTINALTRMVSEKDKEIERLRERADAMAYIYEPIKAHFGLCGVSRDNVRGVLLNAQNNIELIKTKNKMHDYLRDVWLAVYAKNKKDKLSPVSKRMEVVKLIIDEVYKENLIDELPF